MSCCSTKPNQFFFQLASQYPALQTRPAAHCESVSQGARESAAASSLQWPATHVPCGHSVSIVQTLPVARLPILHPGNSGGHSPPVPPVHGVGARLPGKCGGSPENEGLMGTRCGSVFVPLAANTSPSEP